MVDRCESFFHTQDGGVGESAAVLHRSFSCHKRDQLADGRQVGGKLLGAGWIQRAEDLGVGEGDHEIVRPHTFKLSQRFVFDDFPDGDHGDHCRDTHRDADRGQGRALSGPPQTQAGFVDESQRHDGRIWPCSTLTRREHCRATSPLWVVRMMVIFSSRLRERKRAMISWDVTASRDPVGSSARMS